MESAISPNWSAQAPDAGVPCNLSSVPSSYPHTSYLRTSCYCASAAAQARIETAPYGERMIESLLRQSWFQRLLGIPPEVVRNISRAHPGFATPWPLYAAAGLLLFTAIWTGVNYWRDGTKPSWWTKGPLLAPAPSRGRRAAADPRAALFAPDPFGRHPARTSCCWSIPPTVWPARTPICRQRAPPSKRRPPGWARTRSAE